MAVPQEQPRTDPPLRIGSVSYLNAKPLIEGLNGDPAARLFLDVPSRLLDGLRGGRFDVALLPVIDYQRMPGLRLIPAGGIGSDGETLTVRIFSRVPIPRVRTLACDADSHTSVALARILLDERWGVRPELVERVVSSSAAVGGAGHEAQLLIGDKVVCDAPQGYPHQLDLGQAWKEMTGLPFVFAAWFAAEGVVLGDWPGRLERAKRLGLSRVDELIEVHAVPRGWPREVARRYLTSHLHYDVGPRELEAIRLFHGLAGRHGIVPEPVRPLAVVSG